ncbi:type II toxin-antitoxin system Phd/YefM family antitoxin [Vulgatibacter sp.]|uniref:type II toxin-antitoxin system Phd/YefM family antitoxin n=1 Tax=Vulgatibacter sp. TaxID=1971226 RepID=UPI00356A5CE8
MTMGTTKKTIPAGRFKAECLALIDDVARTGQPVVITKRGKPVAQVVPLEGEEPPGLQGSVLYEGDLLSPIDEDWDANR